AQDVAAELDHRHLQAEADPEEGNLSLPGLARRQDLALGAAHPEASRDQDAVDLVERREVAVLELLRVEKLEPDRDVAGDAAVAQRLVEALVALDQLDVLADHPDAHFPVLGVAHLLDDLLPALEPGGAAP